MNGIHLAGKKEASLNPWSIKRPKYPSRVYIPLRQMIQHSSVPCVKIGDLVKIGQKIAEPDHENAVAVHASLSGKVVSIQTRPHPMFDTSVAIEIESDDAMAKLDFVGLERKNWQSLSSEELFFIFQENGLIDLDDGLISLHEKMKLRQNSLIETLVIDACEPEPYVTSDHALIMSHPVEILKGVEILRLVSKSKKVMIAIQDDKLEVAELLKSKIYFLKWDHMEVRIVPTRYPQGLLVPLIRTLFGIDLVPSLIAQKRKNPAIRDALLSVSVLAEHAIAFHSVFSAFAVYEAVALQKPFFEKPVTLAGECVIEPRNIWAPLGYTFQDALKEAKGFMREPGEVIMNGPMRGRSQKDLSVPVIKSTQSILGLPKELTQAGDVEACSHCNDCVDACPVHISPVTITLAAERNLFLEAADWGVEACIVCGNCTYICPAKRPMASLIQEAKNHLIEISL